MHVFVFIYHVLLLNSSLVWCCDPLDQISYNYVVQTWWMMKLQKLVSLFLVVQFIQFMSLFIFIHIAYFILNICWIFRFHSFICVKGFSLKGWIIINRTLMCHWMPKYYDYMKEWYTLVWELIAWVFEGKVMCHWRPKYFDYMAE